ncbi:MAG: helix-turn-helix transcriptional regulator [Lachnospiraceae bacterium]|nr:helix-turn-helix transcriptional regulator [Lachnospiraceae bacterium]
MSNDPIQIGGRIKKARKAAGLSQTELGERLDKTLRTIQKYESGEIEPSIAMINDIARILDTSPAELMGYEKQDLRLNTLSDVLAVLNELNSTAGIRFQIDVKRPPNADEWTCSLTFNGNDHAAEHNADLCLFLERFADERERLETYWTDQDYYDQWFETELAYYAGVKLKKKEVETLTREERLKRRNALIEEQMANGNHSENISGS